MGLGRPRKEQVEVHSEGRDDPRERKGLSVCQVHRVCVSPHIHTLL